MSFFEILLLCRDYKNQELKQTLFIVHHKPQLFHFWDISQKKCTRYFIRSFDLLKNYQARFVVPVLRRFRDFRASSIFTYFPLLQSFFVFQKYRGYYQPQTEHGYVIADSNSIKAEKKPRYALRRPNAGCTSPTRKGQRPKCRCNRQRQPASVRLRC